MTPRHIRAARGYLGWTRERLAKEAGIHHKSVAYWECCRDGSTIDHPDSGAVPKMREALARHGVLVEEQAIRFSDCA